MNRKHTVHAQHVVESFKALLSESGRQHVSQKHFDELSLMIESAISTAALQEVEHVADALAELATSIRAKAEHA